LGHEENQGNDRTGGRGRMAHDSGDRGDYTY
jgi:hypothetical protein